MQVKLDQQVLEVDGRAVTLGEVLAAARLGSWLASTMLMLRDELACVTLAEQENVSLGVPLLQTSIDNWRRARNLSAADETEAMLQSYGVTLSELVDYGKRRLLYQRYHERIEEARQQASPSPRQVEELLPLEIIFERPQDKLIDAFSLRVVASAPPADIAEKERSRLLKDAGLPLRNWHALLQKVYGVDAERCEWLLQVEIAFRLQRKLLINEESLLREFQKNPLDLTRLDVTIVEVSDKDVAKELLCCVCEDHESLVEAAGHGGLSCTSDTWFFADLDAKPFGPHLPSAQPGKAFGPAAVGHHHLVLQLNQRHEADLFELATRARLERQLIERALRKQAAQRVQFAYSVPPR